MEPNIPQTAINVILAFIDAFYVIQCFALFHFFDLLTRIKKKEITIYRRSNFLLSSIVALVVVISNPN